MHETVWKNKRVNNLQRQPFPQERGFCCSFAPYRRLLQVWEASALYCAEWNHRRRDAARAPSIKIHRAYIEEGRFSAENRSYMFQAFS